MEISVRQTDKTVQVTARNRGERLFVTGPSGQQCSYKSFKTEAAAREWIENGNAQKSFKPFSNK